MSGSRDIHRRDFLRVGAVTAASAYALGLARPGTSSARIVDRASVRTVHGRVALGEHTVDVGSTLRFDPNVNTTVTMRGNLVVRGKLEMKPNPGITHTLRFDGIDERDFVGGGMNVLASDIGLWVMGSGRLDLRGAPRAGWNRTGSDPTWASTDEILTAPFEPGDVSTFAPYGGSLASVTSPDGRVFTQEALNLTRSVRIEGTPNGRTHIFIRSSSPQSIRYVAIRHVGPRQGELPDDNHFVIGRYGLHFHMCGRGSAGSVVTGVVLRDCGSHGFVAHLSNGIAFSDCVAYTVNEDAYWWDNPDRSHRVEYLHCMAARLIPIPAYRGYRLAGFNLGLGRGLSADDCVVAGNLGNTGASGFLWPKEANSTSGLTWAMTRCVAHNNRWAGIYFWHNDESHHVVADFVSFRNRIGIEHGSYWNLLHVDRPLTFSNDIGIVVHALSAGPPQDQLAYLDARIYDAVSIVNHLVPTSGTATFYGSTLSHVTIGESAGGSSRYDFVSCTSDGATSLEPADFSVNRMRPTSVYRVQRPDGSAFQVLADGTATEVPAFFPY